MNNLKQTIALLEADAGYYVQLSRVELDAGDNEVSPTQAAGIADALYDAAETLAKAIR